MKRNIDYKISPVNTQKIYQNILILKKKRHKNRIALQNRKYELPKYFLFMVNQLKIKKVF